MLLPLVSLALLTQAKPSASTFYTILAEASAKTRALPTSTIKGEGKDAEGKSFGLRFVRDGVRTSLVASKAAPFWACYFDGKRYTALDYEGKRYGVLDVPTDDKDFLKDVDLFSLMAKELLEPYEIKLAKDESVTAGTDAFRRVVARAKVAESEDEAAGAITVMLVIEPKGGWLRSVTIRRKAEDEKASLRITVLPRVAKDEAFGFDVKTLAGWTSSFKAFTFPDDEHTDGTGGGMDPHLLSRE